MEYAETLFSVDVRAAVLALKAALLAFGSGASVILISSIADAVGVPLYGTYAATEAALRSYARTWTAELSPRGIRVNVVNPKPPNTTMIAATGDEVRAALTSQIPLGRMTRPEKAAAAAFVLSVDAGFIAGTELCVDGGRAQV